MQVHSNFFFKFHCKIMCGSFEYFMRTDSCTFHKPNYVSVFAIQAIRFRGRWWNMRKVIHLNILLKVEQKNQEKNIQFVLPDFPLLNILVVFEAGLGHNQLTIKNDNNSIIGCFFMNILLTRNEITVYSIYLSIRYNISNYGIN